MISCAPKKTVMSTTVIKDSTYIKKTIIPVDTIIKVPKNKTSVHADFKDLTETPIVKHSKNLTASLSKVGNIITADCDVGELELTIRLQNELLEIYRQKETDNTTKVTVPERYIPEWIKPFIWIGASTLILIIIAVCVYLFKKSKPI
jgi:hypothetical protein